MKILQEFVISLKRYKNVLKSLDQTKKKPLTHWQLEKNERNKKLLSQDIQEQRTYVYSGKEFPKAALFINITDIQLEIVNIIPIQEGIFELSLDEYNGLLRNFITNFLPRYKSHLSSDISNLSTYLNPSSKKKLDHFVHTSNISTAHLHPCDKPAWFCFILNVYTRKDDLKLRPEYFKLLLVEEYGYSERAAGLLVASYSECIDLLRFQRRRIQRRVSTK